ncbi:hypothetical protein FGO68_gene15448 [Halteria grandinella]|uniref:Uncharacterized protein n=1 Tax=Halteria grandinella TaxID=5974 RepID=A0A8J8T0W4_HALGN|nr:hypothetical protein FGO68_gene15448 [Halteria grandinella]
MVIFYIPCILILPGQGNFGFLSHFTLIDWGILLVIGILHTAMNIFPVNIPARIRRGVLQDRIHVDSDARHFCGIWCNFSQMDIRNVHNVFQKKERQENYQAGAILIYSLNQY